jgi:hypothetical protein
MQKQKQQEAELIAAFRVMPEADRAFLIDFAQASAKDARLKRPLLRVITGALRSVCLHGFICEPCRPHDLCAADLR